MSYILQPSTTCWLYFNHCGAFEQVVLPEDWRLINASIIIIMCDATSLMVATSESVRHKLSECHSDATSLTIATFDSLRWQLPEASIRDAVSLTVTTSSNARYALPVAFIYGAISRTLHHLYFCVIITWFQDSVDHNAEWCSLSTHKRSLKCNIL